MRSTVAFDSDYLPKDAIGSGIVFLAGIGARHQAAGCFIGAGYAVHSEAVFAASQSHIAATQFLRLCGSDGYCVFIQNIGPHAEAVRAEAYFRAAMKKLIADGGELRGVTLYDGLTHPHGR